MTFSHETAPPSHAASDIADVDTRLQQLITRGYQFVHPTDSDGQMVAVVGVRVHDGVVDVVKLHAEDDVHAMRMPGDEPDIMAPRSTLWESIGCAEPVLDELLALPEHATPGVSCAAADAQSVNGCWVPLRAGASAWLSSSSTTAVGSG